MQTKHNWKDIYESDAPKLLAMCRRYVGDRAIAEDLLHDAFIKAFEKSHTFSGKGEFKAWLRRIVLNTTLNYLRDKKKLSEQLSDSLDKIYSDKQETESNISVRELVLSYGITKEEIKNAIAQLPVHHRTVFNLFVVEGIRHKQIGEMLGISPGTSKSHLARARKKLKKQLQALTTEKEKRYRRPVAVWLLMLLSGKRLFAFMKHESLTAPKFALGSAGSSGVSVGSSVLSGTVAASLLAGVVLCTATSPKQEEYSNILLNHIPQVYHEQSTHEPVDSIAVPIALVIEDSMKLEIKKPVIVRKPVVVRKTVVIKDTIIVK